MGRRISESDVEEGPQRLAEGSREPERRLNFLSTLNVLPTCQNDLIERQLSRRDIPDAILELFEPRSHERPHPDETAQQRAPAARVRMASKLLDTARWQEPRTFCREGRSVAS